MVSRPGAGLMVLSPAGLDYRAVFFEGADWRVSLARNINPND
jgi:hypothetical protein